MDTGYRRINRLGIILVTSLTVLQVAWSIPGVFRAVYKDLPNGNKISALRKATNYPFSPNITDIINSFDAPIHFLDKYGQRLSALFTAEQNGLHKFVMSCDDVCELYFSHDSKRGNAKKILSLSQYTSYMELTKFPDKQKSNDIELVKGSSYLLEALMVEGYGMDHLTVGVEFSNGSLLFPITMDYLTAYVVNGAEEMIENLETLNENMEKYTSLEDGDYQTNGTFTTGFFRTMDEVMAVSTATIWHKNVSVADKALSTMDKFYDLALKTPNATQISSESQLFVRDHYQILDNSTITIFPKSSKINHFIVTGLGKDTTAVGAIYNHLHNVMPTISEKKSKPGEEERINSKVISCLMQPRYQYSSAINNSVQITIETYKQGSLFKNPRCVFWKFPTSPGETGLWSSDGCSVASSSSTHTVCSCTHMTHFAVLMQPVQLPKSVMKEHEHSLRILTYVGCTISIIGVVITLCVYAVLGIITQENVNIHANLCAAIGLTQIIVMAASSSSNYKEACKFITFLLHYFSLTIFSWMLCEGIQLYRKLVAVLVVSSMKLLHIYGIGWGFPLIIAALTIAIRHKSYVDYESCWLTVEHGTRWAFIVPALVVILINTIILGMTFRMFLNASITERKSSLQKVRSSLRAFVILLPLMGITWLFGIFAVNSDTIVFQYIFIILNSTQGIFVFFFHCYGNTEVCGEFKQRRHRRVLNKTIRSTLNSRSTRSTRSHNRSDEPSREQPALAKVT